jgi:hypothetical protein
MEPGSLLASLARHARWFAFTAIAASAIGVASWRLLFVLAVAAGLVLLDALGARSRRRWLRAFDAVLWIAASGSIVYAVTLGLPLAFDVSLPMASLLVLSAVVEASRPATMAATRPVTPCWPRGLALLLVSETILLVTVAWAFGPKPVAVAYAWLVASFTSWPLLVLAGLVIVPGKMGRLAVPAVLTVLFAALVWFIASAQVVVVQAHALEWYEVKSRLSEPGGVGVLAEGLLSPTGAVLALVVFAGVPLLGRGLARFDAAASRAIFLLLAAGPIVGGAVLVRNPHALDVRLAERYLAASSAPWSFARPPEYAATELDWEAARRLRSDTSAPVWAEGPALPLAEQVGRYQDRPIVLVIMEGHGARDVEVLGAGAIAHEASSPQLSRLAGRGLLFRNYFAAGYASRTALWTLFTGLPLSHGVPMGLPAAAPAVTLGGMPHMAELGYDLRAMWGASPRFEAFDLVMETAGARWWIDAAETRDLPSHHATSWGMDDADLFTVARRHFDASLTAGRRPMLAVWTSSNHSPYGFPEELEGRPLSRDNHGGMRYADHWLGWFLDGLLALPERQRPVIMVVADHSHLMQLPGSEPAGILNPEGFRVPGLLLLPDGALAGRTFDGVFTHEDVLDLLLMLARPQPVSPKFVRAHRVFSYFNQEAVLSADSLYWGSRARCFRVVSRWRLEEGCAPEAQQKIREAWESFDAIRLFRTSEDQRPASPGPPAGQEPAAAHIQGS